MTKPKISFVISTYDAASYLNRHLEDLQRQTDPSWEAIVVDSASPGADGIVAQEWMRRDSRIRYYRQPERTNYGVSWLVGWNMANGELISNSNTDDGHHPEFVRLIYSAMCQSDSSVGFCYSGLNVVDDNGKLKARSVKPHFDHERYSYQCEGGPQLTWWHGLKDLLDWGLLQKRAQQYKSAFDYTLALHMMSRGFDGLAVQEILTIYTQRPNSIENSNYGGLSTWESLCSIAEFFPHHFKSRLKEFEEFSDFPRVPEKESWVAARLAGKRWKADKWTNLNDNV